MSLRTRDQGIHFPTMAHEFIGTCVGLKSKDIQTFDDTSREISYETFRRYVGGEITNEINEWAGWPGTHFKNDRHIRYYRGRWKGVPVVCMIHSAIHHIWRI